MTDYLQAVFAMLGPGEKRHADPAAWVSLKEELGRTFPADCKQIVDAHAPVQIDGHLTLSHPASEWGNLGEADPLGIRSVGREQMGVLHHGAGR